GLMALTRFQDGALVAIALLDLPRARWRVLLLAPGLVLAFLPQVAVDQALFGTWLPIRSEEHTSELQSPDHLVCRLLLEKKKKSKMTDVRYRMIKRTDIVTVTGAAFMSGVYTHSNR